MSRIPATSQLQLNEKVECMRGYQYYHYFTLRDVLLLVHCESQKVMSALYEDK